MTSRDCDPNGGMQFELQECFHQEKCTQLRTKAQCTHVLIKRITQVEIVGNKSHQMVFLNESNEVLHRPYVDIFSVGSIFYR